MAYLIGTAMSAVRLRGGTIMFGFGSNRRQVRNDTFGGSRIRNAALAGVGMLAWKWWRNRQSTSQPRNYQDRTFTDTQTRSADSF
jgi:hypothetical protein